VKVTDRDDLIWLAGLLEGEGWFGCRQSGYPRVSIEATDRDVVGRAAMLMEGTVRARMPRRVNTSPTYVCEVGGELAVEVMQALLPHMGARRSSRIMQILYGYGQRLESTEMHCPPGFVASGAVRETSSVSAS